MIRSFVIVFAMLFGCAGTAGAQEKQVQSATLNAMGLGAMQPLSDDDAQQVRGKGTFASVWGSSQANWRGQTSANSYSAGASWLGKGAGASGSSLSVAGRFSWNFGRMGR